MIGKKTKFCFWKDNWHWIVFMPDKKELTNQKLGELWNSFGIQQGNFNLQSWVGKVGAAKVKHETRDGNENAKIAYFPCICTPRCK